MGRKAKLEYNKFIKDRATERAKAKKEAAEAGASESAAGFKLELLKAQQGICLYTGDGLVPTDLDQYVIDHIVPRAKGGPDAAVNYVLTTRRTNDDKADRTPYEWLSATKGWDAYVNRIRERLTSIRHKKAQLLISPDAERLVEKYTALAETAWISKLAQAILDLKFGWRNGNDDHGRKRVVVVSGGLTGRIRRKYKLNQILNPDAKDEEEAEKKNRNDDRHHALDAMVISFIPTWARDTKKAGFFKFPDGVNKELFANEIKAVIPQNICFEKPALAETIYGVRGDGKDRMIVQRFEVSKLAYRSVRQKLIFDLDYLAAQIKSVRDFRIQKLLSDFHTTAPSESAWVQFCEHLYLQQHDGTPGSAIHRVSMCAGKPAEYKDLSKDGKGAWRKGLGEHKGQFVYADTKGKLRVRPVYAFESVKKVRDELTQTVDQSAIKGFFQSGCLVGLEQAVPHAKTPLAPGKYILNTVLADGRARVTDSTGKQSERIILGALFAAGFSRID